MYDFTTMNLCCGTEAPQHEFLYELINMNSVMWFDDILYYEDTWIHTMNSYHDFIHEFKES